MSTSPPLVVADRYRLVAPLGQGGMGRVWRANDVVLHRDVAIKELVPPPGLTPDERQEMRERSLREARAIARLNNINVVRVFDVLRTDADPWIVMEYVPSRSLQDILASDGPFNAVRAGEIGLGVLGALRAAHRAGVVHRDVKPGNVLIGEDGRVVLTDFGLATVPGDPNVTRTGLVLGSPAYISPERARDGTAGPGADLWSLGATLYAAVEGASPFARPSAIATLAALATENPPPARNAGPLKPVLNGLLRKDPAHRIDADEAERLLLRATGRRSRLGFPMSSTMRRPGAGRERPPIVPGVSASAPVVPGPRPPVTSGRPPTPPTASGRTGSTSIPPDRGTPPPVTPGRATPPITSGRAGMPPVTPGRATPPVTHGRATPPTTSGPSDPPPTGRPTIFTPGKATVGRAPRPADAPTRIDPKTPALDATRVDKPATFLGTGTAKPPPPGQEAEPETTPALDATMRGAGSALGSFTAEEVAAARHGHPGRPAQSTPAPTPPPPHSTLSGEESPTPPRPETPSSAEAATGSEGADSVDVPSSVASASLATAVPETAASFAASLPETAASEAPSSAGSAPSAGSGTATNAKSSREPFGPRRTKPAPKAATTDTGTTANKITQTDSAAATNGPAADGAAAVDGSAVDGAAAADGSATGSAAALDGVAGPAEVASQEATTDEGAQADDAVSDKASLLQDDADESEGGDPEPQPDQAKPEPPSAKPAVGARAGAASTTKAVRKKGRGRQAAMAVPKSARPSVGQAAEDAEPSDAENAEPSDAEKAPPGTAETPAATAETPAATAETPAATAETPAATAESPAATAETSRGTAQTAAEAAEGDTPGEAVEAESASGGTADAKTAAASIPAQAGKAQARRAQAEKAQEEAAEPLRKGSGAQSRTENAPTDVETDVETDPEAEPEPSDAEVAAGTNAASDATIPGNAPKGAESSAFEKTGSESDTPEDSTAEDGELDDRQSKSGKSESGKSESGKSESGKPDSESHARVIAPSRSESVAPVSGAPGLSSRPAWQPMNLREPSAGRRGLTVFGVTLTRRQTVVVVGVLGAVLLLLAVIVPIAFVNGGDGGQKQAGPAKSAGKPQSSAPGGAPPSAGATPSSGPQPSSPAALVLPRGWRMYGDAKTGFRVPLPPKAEVNDSNPEEIRIQLPNRLLIIAQTDSPAPDPKADWEQQEAARAGTTYRDYDRIRMDPVNYFQKGVDWEFYYTTSNDFRQRVLKRNFLTGPKKAYSINWYVSPDDWDASWKDLEVIFKGFEPLP